MPAVQLNIYGEVQGVFFRATAQSVAQRLGITGWIKNTNEGFVQALAVGDENALHQFIEWCHQGPEKSKVIKVEATSVPDATYKEFLITRD